MDHEDSLENIQVQSEKRSQTRSIQSNNEQVDGNPPEEFKSTVGSIDALLKKLEEDDKILKELEELEKKDRVTAKKLSSSSSSSVAAASETLTTTTINSATTATSTSIKGKSSTMVTTTIASRVTPSLSMVSPSSSIVSTVSKSTTAERETQYTSPSPPPSSSNPLSVQPPTQTAGTNTISTKSVSTSTTATNISSAISERVTQLSDHYNSPSSPLSRFGQLALASYGISLAGSSNNSGTTSGVGGSNLSSSMPSLIDHQQALQLLQAQLQAKGQGSSMSPHELDRIMEKLEHDNRILAELDQKVKRISSTSSGISSPVLLSSSLPTLSGITHPTLLQTLYPQLFPALLSDRNILMRDNKRLLLQPSNNSSSAAYYDDDIEQIQLLQALIKNQQQELAFDVEDIADYIEVPNRGRCKVYIARYSYDPFKQSPNENPESELHLAAGDFILVFGDMDEDGFYFGELLDGRRGLVPSNFIEKLTGEDLFEFQASVLYEGRDGDESTCSYPPEFYDALLDDVIGHSNFQHLIAPEDFHRMNDYIELCESSDIDEEDLSDPERAQANAAKDTVPPPKRLLLERQLHKSILLGWLAPDCPRSYIDNYQIYVDGVLKVTVPSNERTRALVEGVDSSIPHRISVRAITPQGRSSRDAACTIVVGKNVPFAPCSVKSTNITATSALISWLPSNSNFYHVVAVNSVEVKTVGPSIYKNLITGLSPNTMYRVSVRAKPGKLLCSEEKNPKKLEMLTTFVDFRTLPKSLPEPPVDVQIESGPQDGTLLVTWLPVTMDQFGTSNGCPVTGYAVFSSHKKLAEIDSPTSDHALLDISQIESFHKKAITVRTKSGENLSQDSIPCHIPEELIKFTNQINQISNNNNNLRKSSNNNYLPGQLRVNQPYMIKSHSDSESETEINQLINNVARRSSILFDPISNQTQNSPASIRGPGMVQNRGQTRMIQPSQPNQPGQLRQTVPQQFHSRNPNQPQHPYQNQMANQQHPTNRNQMNQQIQGPHNQQQQSNQSNMHVSSIAINKDMHQNGKKPMGQPGNRLGGPSPQPPQRNRQYTDHERSHFGQGRGAMGGPQSRVISNRSQSQQQQQQQQHPIGQRDIRYFVALYDYDPLTMSPNPDAANEELPFREGDIIKIYGDKDPDGFYRGELNDRIGFVPCNMVSEVQYDPETGQPLRMGSGLGVGGTGVGTKEIDPWAHLPVKKMIALYDYDPQELSPNPDAEMELAFNAGDTIYVYGDLDEDGFYMGELNGNRGLVPSNFLSEALTDGTTRHGSQNHPINRGPTGDSRQSMSHQQANQHQQFQAHHQTGHQQQSTAINQQQHHQQQLSTQSQVHHQQQLIHSQQQQQGFQLQTNQNLHHQPQQQQHSQHHQQGQGYGQHQFQGQQHQSITSNQQKLVNQPMVNNNLASIGQQQGMRPQGNFTNMNQSIHNQQQQLGIQQRPNSLELRSNQQAIGNQQQQQQLMNHQLQNQQLNQMGNQQQQFNQQQKMLQQNLHQNPNQMNQHPSQQSTNPISNLLNSGKQMLSEATTPRIGQPPSNFDSHGQQSMMGHQQQLHGQNQINHLNQQGSNINNANGRFNSSLNQQQQHQGQQPNYPGQHQQLNQQQSRQFGYSGNPNVSGQGSMGLLGGQQGQGQNQQVPTLSGALGAVKSIFKI